LNFERLHIGFSGGQTTHPKKWLLRLNNKHQILKSALATADVDRIGSVPLSSLKDVLVSLNVVTPQQLASGELDGFLMQHSQGGQVNYNAFADSVKAQDLAQLKQTRN